MKKHFTIKLQTEDENGVSEEIEVDSCWSQESEMFCEGMAKLMKE